MESGPSRRRPETLRRSDGLPVRAPLPRRPDAPLRKPDPNLRSPEGVVRRPTLAVDLGTLGSGAVLVTTERDTLVEDPDNGHGHWPSTVAHDGVSPRFGGAAENYGRVHPHACRTRIKSLLGEPGTIRLGDQSFRPAELVGWLLAGMRAQALRLTDVDPTRAVLAVPVGWRPGDRRRADLLEAARLGGFTTVELLAEPLAAVAAPIAGGQLSAGDMALLCDFGAGGFTASLVSVIKGGTVELVGYQEHPECSGLEVDRLIMNELLARAGRAWSDLLPVGDDPVQRARSARALRTLEERARVMKHQLSSHASAVELVGPEEVAVELTAPELAGMIAPLLYKAVDDSRRVLADTGVRTGELAAVLLTGGASRMPAVADVLAETFHRPVRASVDQPRAVVEGAARFARAVDRRHVRARVATERETPLRWDLPGGEAFDLQWLRPPGTRFGANDPLACVRLPDGSLWELRSGRAGTLLRTHLPTGSAVASGDWLVTVELDVRPFR